MNYSRLYLSIIFLTNIFLIITYNLFYAQIVQVRVLTVEKKENELKEGDLGKNGIIRKSEVSSHQDEAISDRSSDDVSDKSESSSEDDDDFQLQEQIKEKLEQEERRNKLLNRYLTNAYEQLNPMRKYYEQVPEQFYNMEEHSPSQFVIEHLKILNNNNYCDQSDLHFLLNQISKTSFITDYEEDNKLYKQILMQRGTQNTLIKQNEEEFQLLPYEATIFWTKDPLFHYYHEIGVQAVCQFQKYNQIPGNGVFIKPRVFANLLNDYKKEKNEACLEHIKIFPNIYFMKYEEECKQFFANNDVKQVFKLGLTFYEKDPIDMDQLKIKFDNGNKCGDDQVNLILQTQEEEILKIRNQQFYIQNYVLIASTDPLLVFYAQDFIEFQNKEVQKLKFYIFKSDEEMQSWTLGALQNELQQLSLIDSDVWLKETLYPQLESNIRDYTAISLQTLFKDQRVFQLIKVSHILDEKLNLRFDRAGEQLIDELTETILVQQELQQAIFEEVLDIVESLQKAQQTQLQKKFFNVKEEKIEDIEFKTTHFMKLNIDCV